MHQGLFFQQETHLKRVNIVMRKQGKGRKRHTNDLRKERTVFSIFAFLFTKQRSLFTRILYA